MSSQLQENFPLRRAADSFEISFTKWLRGTKTVQLPVTFSMRCQTVLIDMFSELEEHPARFAEISENDVEKFIEGKKMQTQRKTFYGLKLAGQNLSGRRAPRNHRHRADSSN